MARDFAAEEDKSTLAELIALFRAAGDPMARHYAIERILNLRSKALERVKERMYRLLERCTQNEGCGFRRSSAADSNLSSATL